MNRKMEYKNDMVGSINDALDGLPDSPPERAMSAREVVMQTAEKIRSRLDAGYTYQQIVETLAGAGFKISAGTLKTYLSISMRQQKPKRKRIAKEVDGNECVNKRGNERATKLRNSVGAVSSMQSKNSFQDPDEK